MTTRERGASWQASVSHKGKRYRKDFPTQHEALAWEHQMKADLKAGRIQPEAAPAKACPTLAEHLDTVYRARWAGTKGEETAMINARHVVDALGPDRLVSTLCKQDALTCKTVFQERGISDATINRKLAALSVLVKEAVEYGHLAKNFTVGLTKERQTRIRFVTEDEEAAMLEWCKRTHNHDLMDYIILSIDTGFRQGEVLRIEAQDCGKPNLWTYDTKAGSNREVPLTDRAAHILSYRSWGMTHKQTVFTLSARQIRERWFKMLTGINMIHDETLIPHALRHTFVTRLLHRGVDIKTVMELAGHSRIETTQRYAQTSPERKVMAIQRLAPVTEKEAPQAEAILAFLKNNPEAAASILKGLKT